MTQTDSERAAFVAKRAFKVRMIVEEILSTERGFCETLDKLGDLEMRLRQQFLSVQVRISAPSPHTQAHVRTRCVLGSLVCACSVVRVRG